MYFPADLLGRDRSISDKGADWTLLNFNVKKYTFHLFKFYYNCELDNNKNSYIILNVLK